MLKKILSARTNVLSICLHAIVFAIIYISSSILIFLTYYFILDKGLGSSPEKTNKLATNLIFYLPLIVISRPLIIRSLKMAYKTEFETSKTNLISCIIAIALYAYFWLH